MHTYSSGDTTYDVNVLWQLAPRAEYVSIGLVMRGFDERVWGRAPTPRQVLMERSGPIWHDVLRADLRFALIVTPDWWVADGNHRLVKAVYLRKPMVRIRRFESREHMLPAVIGGGKKQRKKR